MYKLIANGLFFSFTFFFLAPKYLTTLSLISFSDVFSFANSWTKPTNSSNESLSVKIDEGELLSNSPSGAQNAFATPPYFAGSDNALTW